MKRYFVDDNGRRRKVTKSNLSDYRYAKDLQWGRIFDKLRNSSGEREIETLQNQIFQAETALEDDSDKWNNNRDEIYADWIEDDMTKDDVDRHWEEHLEELSTRITKLKNELITTIINMNLKCRPERTAKEFIKRFGNREQFLDDLEDKVMKELNM